MHSTATHSEFSGTPMLMEHIDLNNIWENNFSLNSENILKWTLPPHPNSYAWKFKKREIALFPPAISVIYSASFDSLLSSTSKHLYHYYGFSLCKDPKPRLRENICIIKQPPQCHRDSRLYWKRSPLMALLLGYCSGHCWERMVYSQTEFFPSSWHDKTKL